MSQWWKSSFTIETDTYSCMEQYMMAEKARLFKDDKALKRILNNKSPKQIKELGRQVRGFDDGIWKKYSPSIILNGNLAKFQQDENLKHYLMETKGKILVEASPYDKIWGIGLSTDHDNVNNPLLWKGQNLLGFALMEVRDELIRICENEYKLDYKKNYITNMISNKGKRTMRDIILQKLKDIEKEHKIKILYAVESGSRGWGFESKDSDYDVRFIYIHKPDWYLSIKEKRDVVELPINDLLDINGWDLRKTLVLFRKVECARE